jgi:hypothetical protein
MRLLQLKCNLVLFNEEILSLNTIFLPKTQANSTKTCCDGTSLMSAGVLLLTFSQCTIHLLLYHNNGQEIIFF